jgi:hypothetical protein
MNKDCTETKNQRQHNFPRAEPVAKASFHMLRTKNHHITPSHPTPATESRPNGLSYRFRQIKHHKTAPLPLPPAQNRSLTRRVIPSPPFSPHHFFCSWCSSSKRGSSWAAAATILRCQNIEIYMSLVPTEGVTDFFPWMAVPWDDL